MGFFSEVGTLISSCVSCCVSAVKGVSHFIAGSISGLGKNIGKIAGFLVNTLAMVAGSVIFGPVIGPIIANLFVKGICKVVSLLAKKLQVTQEEEAPEEVGYRMEEAEEHPEWKQREEFESFKEYYNYLKQQIPDETIDQKRMQDSLGVYRIIGASTLYEEIGVQEGIELPKELMLDIGRAKLTAEEFKCMLDVFKQLKIEGDSINDFMRGTMNFKEATGIYKALEAAFQDLYPDKSQQEVMERLDDIQSATRGDFSEALKQEDGCNTIKRLYEQEIKEEQEKREPLSDAEKVEFDQLKG